MRCTYCANARWRKWASHSKSLFNGEGERERERERKGGGERKMGHLDLFFSGCSGVSCPSFSKILLQQRQMNLQSGSDSGMNRQKGDDGGEGEEMGQKCRHPLLPLFVMQIFSCCTFGERASRARREEKIAQIPQLLLSSTFYYCSM